MDNQNAQLTREIHENFSSGNFDRCLELADENIRITAHGFGMTFNGKSEFGQFMQGFKQAFPDMRLEHTNIVSNGNKVAVEFTAYGTHTGPLQTPAGTIPPSGNSIDLKVAEFYEWDAGRVKSFENYQDVGSLMRQIGAM